MARPKVRGKRRGGRNRQFFEGLSGLARGLDAAIDANLPKSTWGDVQVDQEARRVADEKLAEAEAKRKRKAYARLRASGLLKGDPV